VSVGLGQAINAVTGVRLGLLSFLFLERFCFYAAAAAVVGLLLFNGSDTSMLTHTRFDRPLPRNGDVELIPSDSDS